MPVKDYIKPNKNTEIITWKIKETPGELIELIGLTPEQLKKYHSLRPKQGLEYLGLRACLKELNVEAEIWYDEKGKPYLPGEGHHISITHSYGMVSVGISESEIGIDIEKRRNEKVLNIERKFIREDEAIWIPENEQKSDYLHIIWGIKEGLYKINGGNLWNFLHHYKVGSFNLVENEPILCWISDKYRSRKYYAYYKKIDNFFLIWVLDSA